MGGGGGTTTGLPSRHLSAGRPCDSKEMRAVVLIIMRCCLAFRLRRDNDVEKDDWL